MSTIYDDPVQFRGPVSFSNEFYPPAGKLTNAHFSSDVANRLAADKLISQRSINVPLCDDGTDIPTITGRQCHIVRGLTATLVGIEASITGAATTDRTVSVDVQKSTAGGAFATVLSTPILIQNGTAIRTALAATLASTALVDGDILRVVVTLGGSSGTRPQGLVVCINLREDPT